MGNQGTEVVIVGAGVAGLTLGTFLLKQGIGCMVLEKQSRAEVEGMQRAGVLDTHGVRMFRRWGLEERIVGGVPTYAALTFKIDGALRTLELDPEHVDDSRFCPQRVLVRNLIEVFVGDGGDLRFEVDVAIDLARPAVTVSDARGTTTIECVFIAGCDGDHGTSRSVVPAGVLTRTEHDYGYAWLTVLAEAAPNHQALMGIHERGFAGQFMRGPSASRYYLQCPLDDASAAWPDERIWDELELRFGEAMSRGPIASTQIVPMRSVVHSPMRHGPLFLLGDAAHLVPPMSAKGMSLALRDAEVLALAIIEWKRTKDAGLLEAYSSTCLRHVWTYQAFARWFTDLIHDAGDVSYCGPFRHRIARAELERLFVSRAAASSLGEQLAGFA